MIPYLIDSESLITWTNKYVWLLTRIWIIWRQKMAKIVEFFGLDCVPRLFKTIKFYGGIKACLYKMYRMDGLKPGCCVGEDKYGNKYFENNSYFVGRNRWVEYAPYYALEYDGSQIPAEWFGWMHHKTDLLPDCDPSRPQYKWMTDYTENLTGTPGQFMPYSTTKPKIHAWVPGKKTEESECWIIAVSDKKRWKIVEKVLPHLTQNR